MISSFKFSHSKQNKNVLLYASGRLKVLLPQRKKELDLGARADLFQKTSTLYTNDIKKENPLLV